MPSSIYFVKQESGLFRKGSWNITMDRTTVGMYPDRETALTAAVGEAERTSYMGRQTEVWVYEGDGFVLYKAFKAQKPREEDEDIEEEAVGFEEEVLAVDDPTTDPAAY